MGSATEVAAGADGDGGAFSEEDVIGGAVGERLEGGAVEGAEVGLDMGGAKRVDLPAGVGYAVLAGAAVAAFGVTPVVLGDELVEAVGSDGFGEGRGLDGDGLPVAAVAPVVADVEGGGGGGPGVAGAGGRVGLAVEGTGGEGNGVLRNDLGDEDYSAAGGAVGQDALDVEAEVHFFEVGVERDGDALEADAGEEEAYEGDEALRRHSRVGVVAVEIEFDAWRKVGSEECGVDGVLGHDELAPFGGQESGHCVEDTRLGFEGEILDPAELLGGIGDEGVAGLGDAAEGVVGGEAFAAEEGGEEEGRAADTRETVGHDGAVLEEVLVEGFEEIEEGFGGLGDAAVGDGEVAEEDAMTIAGGALVL